MYMDIWTNIRALFHNFALFCGSCVDHFCYVCFMIVFVMLYCLFLAALWSPAGKFLTSLLSCVLIFLAFCHFSIWCLGQVWYLIVLTTDLCLPLYCHKVIIKIYFMMRIWCHKVPYTLGWYTNSLTMKRLTYQLRSVYANESGFLLPFSLQYMQNQK